VCIYNLIYKVCVCVCVCVCECVNKYPDIIVLQMLKIESITDIGTKNDGNILGMEFKLQNCIYC